MEEDVCGSKHRRDEHRTKERLKAREVDQELGRKSRNMLLPVRDLTLPTDGGGLQRRNCIYR